MLFRLLELGSIFTQIIPSPVKFVNRGAADQRKTVELYNKRLIFCQNQQKRPRKSAEKQLGLPPETEHSRPPEKAKIERSAHEIRIKIEQRKKYPEKIKNAESWEGFQILLPI